MQLDFTIPLYESQPDDKFATIAALEGGEPRQINLNAITYYAKLGMKPKGIHALVGCTAMTIFNNSQLREAYETGRAFHTLYLRAAMMAQAPKNGFVADMMLGRAVGKAEQDAAEGEDPSQNTGKSSFKVTLEVENTENDPDIQELKQLVERRMAEGAGK